MKNSSQHDALQCSCDPCFGDKTGFLVVLLSHNVGSDAIMCGSDVTYNFHRHLRCRSPTVGLVVGVCNLWQLVIWLPTTFICCGGCNYTNGPRLILLACTVR